MARTIDHTLLKPEATAAEAALAIAQGADEIDMVIDISPANARRFADVQADIAAVRASIPALLGARIRRGSDTRDGCSASLFLAIGGAPAAAHAPTHTK